MPEIGVPPYLPLTIAAALAGLTRTTFAARYLDARILQAEARGRGNSRSVPTAALERELGKPITATDYLAAIQSRRKIKNTAEVTKAFVDAANVVLTADRLAGIVGEHEKRQRLRYGVMAPMLDRAIELGEAAASLIALRTK